MRGTTTTFGWAAAAALTAVLATAGCGGDSDEPAAAPPVTTAATTAAATTPAATTPADEDAGSTAGTASCAGLLQAASATLTEVGTAGFDLKKAGAAYAKGAAAVRAEARKVGGAAGQAGEQVAVEMDAAGTKVQAADTDNPTEYVEAQKKVGAALVALTKKCGVGG